MRAFVVFMAECWDKEVPMDWNKLSDDERLIAEEAVATFRAVKLAGQQAPHGKGLACLEQAVRQHGDELLRNTLQPVINMGREDAKKGVSRLCCCCGGKAKFKRVSPKCVLTTVGEMRVGRRYYACAECGVTQTPLDAWAGIGSRMASEHARRVIVVAGSTWSFEQASAKLLELCRMRVSNDTIRAECDEEGERAGRWVRSEQVPLQSMAKAAGELEFSSDGMKINTTGGWAEMRLSVLDKRESGEGVVPEQWADRVLPGANSRVWRGVRSRPAD